MKKTVLLAMLLFSLAAMAQQPSAYPYSKPFVNDPTTGTTQFATACTTNTGAAVICPAGATNGYVGVCVSNCGKTGSAWIAFAGSVPLLVDGTTTAQHYVQLSATAGNGHDSGAATFPTSGADIIGVVLKPSTGAASVSMIDVWAPEIQPAGAGSTTYSVLWSQAGGSTSTNLITFGVNAIKVTAMVVSVPIKVSNIEYIIGTPDTSGTNLYDVGIYGPCTSGQSNCPLVTHIGATAGSSFSASTGAHNLALIGAPVSIASGRYYWATTCSAGCTAAISGLTGANMAWISASTASTSTSSGGVLPATIIVPTDSPGAVGGPEIFLY